MTITTPRTKTDQTGETAFAKAVFANPKDPSICPVLALAVNIFTRPATIMTESPQLQLFNGDQQEDRFCDILASVLRALPASKAASLGAKAEDIGSHSARKGAASFVSAAVDGPTPVATFLRAGWSLGNTKDRYLFEGEGADQLCGRVVCGLPIMSHEFATLPPHLSNAHLQALTDDDWATLLPAFRCYPETFRQCIPFLLASLVYHEDFLTRVLPPEHGIFHSPVFVRGYIKKLRGKSAIHITTCPDCDMRASGVPGIVAVNAQVAELRDQVQTLQQSLSSTIHARAAEIEARQRQLPDEVVKKILDNIVINGTAPVTQSDIDALRTSILTLTSTLRDDILRALDDKVSDLSSRRDQHSVPQPSESLPQSAATTQWGTWFWGGHFHPVPQGWRFPRHGVKVVFLEWMFGNQGVDPPIKPLRFLKGIDLVDEGE